MTDALVDAIHGVTLTLGVGWTMHLIAFEGNTAITATPMLVAFGWIILHRAFRGSPDTVSGGETA